MTVKPAVRTRKSHRKSHVLLALGLTFLGSIFVACQRTEEAEGPAVEADQGPEPGERRRRAHAISEGGPDLEAPLPADPGSEPATIDGEVDAQGLGSRGGAEPDAVEAEEEDAPEEGVEELAEP